MTYLEEPTEEDIHLARWLLGGFVLLTAASSLIPDDWDGIGLNEFRAQLREEYGTVIRDWLTQYHIPWLESRGIPVGVSATSTPLSTIIERVTNDTIDLHRSMQESFASGGFSTWGGATHQGLILRDMARIAGDHLNESIASRLEEDGLFTGRQRWETSGEDSRHAELNMQVSSTGWRYKGEHVTRPRWDPQNPKAWSGCSCRLSYEWQAGDGTTGWL